MPTYGLEEEVFVTEPEKPSLQSLYYLSKLFWKNPGYYYTHTASNFARGADLKQGLMSGIEIATDRHTSIEDLWEELKERRKDLDRVCEGLIIPLGHLINYQAPTNTCAFQLHIGEVRSQEAVYKKLVYFLPLLALLTVNSPYAGGRYFGQSYRIFTSYAIGPLQEDPEYRFQDIIISKRIKTIEIRIFDPIWDLDRILTLLKAIEAIVNADINIEPDIVEYDKLRTIICLQGYVQELEEVYLRLKDIYESYLQITFGMGPQVKDFYEQNGLLKTYSALDNAYRRGELKAQEARPINKNVLKVCAGILGYYIPKLPYVAWKYWREWH